MKVAAILLAALALFPVCNAFAEHESMDMSGMAGMSTKTDINKGIGVVDAVDRAKGVVTLSHEPIAGLGWPAMTMDFVVEDKKLFNKLIVGKKVQFQFVRQHNSYVVKEVK
jgi:Cu(I)/Ag(I) efflux system periplasmic protein CusF